MVDMHIHTLYSDGDKSLEEVLQKCEMKQLEYISITDHNTIKAYEDKALKQNVFSGKIIMGVEMDAYIDNKRIEFLGYNIKQPEIINEWSNKFYSHELLEQKFNRDKNKIIKICHENGLTYNLDNIKKDIPVTDFFVIYMYYELIKYEENITKMGDCSKSFNDFWKNGLENPKSIFYMGEDKSPKPMYKDVANVIHNAGGLVFLAHPFKYNFNDTLGFIDKLKNEIKLDGIECFHPTSEIEDRIDILVNYAKNNNLYISGGSDYHGDKKKNNDIGIGSGNLNIPKEYIQDWANQ